FAIAVVTGLGLGIAGGLSEGFDAFMRPWVVIMRSTPVVAFILLALIWFKNDSVPVFIGILTMFPMIYINIVDGIRSVDGKTVEMARFYGIDRPRMVREVYLPAIAPFVVSGISSAVGIGWRAIVVGEVLSQPRYGIGTVMHSAQTFLQVEILIAWTFVAIIIGALFEWLIRLVERRIIKWK
ncbi:MAG: ABC transporter permease subunit, partial [Bacteroidales bacterium]|nr:ABC transporter permease subunit [Bacteroidales bacterium]